MSPGTLRSVSATRALCNNVGLALILQAGDWSNVVTPMRHYFKAYVPLKYGGGEDAVQRAALELE